MVATSGNSGSAVVGATAPALFGEKGVIVTSTVTSTKRAAIGPIAFGTIVRAWRGSGKQADAIHYILRANGKDRHLYSDKGRPLHHWLDRALRINSLSPEESAVAYYYAQGLDNAQIDEAQGWPRLKANGHGVNALTKLGLNSREEVAGYLA